MRLIIPFIIFLFFVLAPSCKSNKGATNEYKNARVHPSETIAKEHKKASKKAERDFLKNQKKNKKKMQKKNSGFFKK
ncbi:MAG: hypothetical protein Fur0041_20360 [Bacteroidia bacterium]